MKKLLIIVLSLMLTFALFACGTQQEEKTADGWTIAKNEKQVTEATGLDSFSVPKKIKIADVTFRNPVISYKDGVAQAYYEEGATAVTVRKAEKSNKNPLTDRDLKELTAKWDIVVNNIPLVLYGKKESAPIVGMFSDDKNNYCITSQGLGGEEFTMNMLEIVTIAADLMPQ